jgi:hypothetical protein
MPGKSACSMPSMAYARSAISLFGTESNVDVRAFFEKLWRWDQVVFDASASLR